MIVLRLASRISSILSKVTFASHGPTLFMLSMLAAMIAVETLSRLVGMVIAPVVLSCFDSRLISILPILPDFWSSRRSSSGPNKPSVCPKTAPMTSGFSTTPSTSNRARITYFTVTVCDDFILFHLNHKSVLNIIERPSSSNWFAPIILCDFILLLFALTFAERLPSLLCP